ncbi:MAG TPA: SMC family ATPase [Actinomycetota bacterium]|nr:SMC family ATPase [Actinomycetota bacterium]
MRPLELRMEGFKSFRRPVEFDFEGRTMFGIVGPTGAGKSSILDALIFALYGKTPRLERDTKKLINSLESEAKVELKFETDGRAWAVTRVIRPGKSQVVLNRIDGGSEQVTGERAVNDRVVELTGLDFQAFCSAITLPQGDFSRFLSATSSERSRILKGIFRLERVDRLRDLAKQKHAGAAAEKKLLQGELSGLPENLGAEIPKLEELLKDAEGKVERIREELVKVAAAEAALERSAGRVAELEERRKRTVAAIGELPDLGVLEGVAEEESKASEAARAAEKSLAEAEEGLAESKKERTELEVSLGGAEWMHQVQQLMHSAGRIEKEVAATLAELESLAPERSLMEKLTADATLRVDTLKKDLETSRQEIHSLHRLHAANIIRADLEPGAPCPVCAQPVAHPPSPVAAPAVEKAEENKAALERALDTAREDLSEARQKMGRVEERLRLLAERKSKEQDALREVSVNLLELAGKDAGRELEARRKKLAAADASLAAASKRHESALATERTASKRSAESRTKRHAFTVRIHRVCGVLGLDTIPEDEEASGLAAAAKRAMDEGQGILEKVENDLVAVKQSAAAAVAETKQFREKYSLGPREPVAEGLATARGTVADIKRKIEESTKGAERRLELEVLLDSAQKVVEVHERLASDLTDSKFTAYLLDAQRKLLSDIASEKLLELTQRYRFDDEGEFGVIDVRTDSHRSSDTLSGGETFLASLALAVALAETAAQGGGTVECFFFDEGFGTLDAEILDLALEAIESLVRPGRLIGLISHVPGIKSRLDDLIVLDRDSEGSTVVEQYEGPLGYAASAI